jgi:hypothetical protein
VSWQHVADAERKARKEYKCSLCGQRIRRLALHIVRTGFNEYGPATMRMHAVCENATQDWDQMDWETCIDAYEFFHYLKGGES